MSGGLGLSIGLVAGAVLTGPLGFLLGTFARRDRRVTRYVTPSLRRNVE